MDVVVDDVTQIWGEESTQVMALEHFSHHFRSGRFSCLLGPSGCGKSTLIQIVGGLEPATKGRVRIQNPETPDRQRPLGADSVMVWQNLNLFPWRNVIDNVATDEEMGYVVAKIEPGMHRWAADQLKTTDGVEDKYRFIRYIEKLENIIIHPGSQR
jgi:NitT/TauT family transport system ATP-binding protein